MSIQCSVVTHHTPPRFSFSTEFFLKYQAVKLSPGGSFAPLRSPGAVYVTPYTWCCICGTVYMMLYMQCCIHKEKGGRGVRGARKTRPLSLTEAPRQLIVSKDSQGFLRSQGPQEAQEWGGARGERGARVTRPMSLTEDPKLWKVSKGSQGFLRPQGGPKGPGRLRR